MPVSCANQVSWENHIATKRPTRRTGANRAQVGLLSITAPPRLPVPDFFATLPTIDNPVIGSRFSPTFCG